jgi:hypothetical protein
MADKNKGNRQDAGTDQENKGSQQGAPGRQDDDMETGGSRVGSRQGGQAEGRDNDENREGGQSQQAPGRNS